ncbi:MAG: lantibiotic dehydratase [Streptosporangiaceae bacterium]
MTRPGPFVILTGSTVLARIPLLPAAGHGDQSGTVDPLLAEGMFLASRQAGAAALADCRAEDDGLAATARAYELRARFRPTPHGVFAGVASARVRGDGVVNLSLGDAHRVLTWPSGAWLAALSDRVLDMPGVLARLTLQTSNLIVRRGQRFEHEKQATPGVAGPQLVSVRATDACVLILRECERGASYPQVAARVTRAWPDAPQAMIGSTVLELVRGGFLLTDLLPESGQDDPLGHLLARLFGSQAPLEPLERLRGHLRDADRSPPGTPERLASLVAARDVCDGLAYADRPLSADVAADAQVTIPAGLAAEAAQAVGVLWRVSDARGALADYHQRFIERYGPGRFVPLLEVADPATGLGDIETENGMNPAATSADRAAILAELLTEAVTRGKIEVELDEGTVDALDKHRAGLQPPATAEVYARVFAASGQDLAAGWLSLAIYDGGTQQAGSTVGRFASLLPGVTAGPAACGPALTAEIVVRPRTPELAGVARPTGFAVPRIPVGVPARDGDLDLRDLLVVSAGGCLLLWTAAGRQVIPVLYSRIGPRYIPPLARLLQELGMQGSRPWHGWSWEPLEHSLFQPRIRYKRTVISPARWRLPMALIKAAGDRPGWGSAVASWQSATVPHPPQIAVAEDADRHLPLDLRRDTDRELLRRYVRRGLTAVTELPGGPDAVQAVVPGPAGRYVLELVIPLASRAAVPSRRPSPAPRARPLGDGLYLPGSEWLSAAIPSPSSCHDEILCQLAGLAAGMAGFFDRWFWLRYHNAVHGAQLRIRFHGDPVALGRQVLPALSAWCTNLITHRLASGLAIEPYDQETERYGGREAAAAAERVFDADSRLVLAVLATSSGTDSRLVTAALSAAAIARTVVGGDLAALAGRNVDRAARRRVCALRPLARTAAETGSAVTPAARPEWAGRDSALADYRDTLPGARRADCASSLIHMHANRLLGDRDSERVARALAADLLAREAAR